MKVYIKKVHIIKDGKRKCLPICETLKTTLVKMEPYRLLIKEKHSADQVLFTYDN